MRIGYSQKKPDKVQKQFQQKVQQEGGAQNNAH